MKGFYYFNAPNNSNIKHYKYCSAVYENILNGVSAKEVSIQLLFGIGIISKISQLKIRKNK